MKKEIILCAKKLVRSELLCDIGSGDITTNTLIRDCDLVYAEIISKGKGILCGIDIAGFAFKALDKGIDFKAIKKDGQIILKGEILAEIKGKPGTVLSAERTALNFIQHLSGIATQTHKAVRALGTSRIKILDTRKTLPGLRMLEKYAVRTGGGRNHRFGLYDGILIKGNHLKFQTIASAVRIFKKRKPKKIIEVEAGSLKEAKKALDSGADIIMLDNFSEKDIKRAVKAIKGRAKIEISGGINIKNVNKYRNLKIDFISMGCLTHSAPALDICLRMMSAEKFNEKQQRRKN